MPFCRDQLTRLDALWSTMLRHRFLRDTRDGTISHDRFAVWMRQDYLFVEAAIPFIAALIPRAPREHWAPLAGVITALEKELALFEERAATIGVRLRGAPASFTNHAYIQFLMATASRASYAEAYTVLYAAEKAYHDSWKVVQAGIARDSKWYPFVENWAGEAFAQYVAYLERELDGLAERTGADERARMAEYFELTVKYEIAFWEMAATGEGWPGLGG
jgi:thiaminase